MPIRIVSREKKDMLALIARPDFEVEIRETEG